MSDTYFGLLETDPKEEDLIEFIESHPLCVSEKSQDAYEWSPLYDATRRGYDNIVKALLKHHPEVDFKDSHGRTPLWIAAQNGEEEIVRVLLQTGASPSVECCTCKLSALHIAVQKRHLEVVRLLVKGNLFIDPKDARGETPLFKAVRNNDLEMVKELLECGASKSIQNDEGKTLEMLVTEAGDSVYIDPKVETEITGKIRAGANDEAGHDKHDDDEGDKYDYDNDPYLNKFLDHIEERGLEAFFTRDDADLKESLRPYTIQARTLIKELNAEREESASEVALLTLYDLAILIDDSTSMLWEEQGTRIQVLADFLKAISHIYSFARDGRNGKIRRIRFLNSRKGGDYVDSASVEKLLYKHSYSGMTRIGTQLKKKILTDLVCSKMPRPLLVMITTDGEVQGERKNVLFDVLSDVYSFCKNFATGEYSVSFMFCRIGDDQGAKDMLEKLDNHEELGKHIDCQRAHIDLASILNKTHSFQEVTKLLIGAISSEWDDL